eukprot:8533899-Pyramimonas_sp.AAC.1
MKLQASIASDGSPFHDFEIIPNLNARVSSPLSVQRTVQRHLDEKYEGGTAPTVLAVWGTSQRGQSITPHILGTARGAPGDIFRC